MEEINLGNDVAPQKKNNKNVWTIVTVSIISFIVILVAIVALIPSEKTSQLEITGTTISVEYNEYLGYSATIKGTAKNTTNKNYSYASIEFTVYDADGNNLGTAWTNINNLASGDTWQFEASLLSFPSSRPTSYKLIEITAW